MFYVNTARSRNPNPSGKFLSTFRASSQASDRQDYRDHTYQVMRRSVGMTRKRTSFVVTITAPGAAVGAYLQPFSSPRAAHDAARRWIDTAHQRRPGSITPLDATQAVAEDQ